MKDRIKRTCNNINTRNKIKRKCNKIDCYSLIEKIAMNY